MNSIKWWLKLLDVPSKTPYIWRASDPPTNWINLTSDASESSWAIHDYRSMYLCGKFDKSFDDAIIAAKEMRAINNYIEYADPGCNTGIRLLTDNMQVMWCARKKAVGPSVNSKFKKEFWNFAKLVEKRSLTVLVDWISTHHNICADWGTRSRPLLGAASASALIGRQLDLHVDHHLILDVEREWRLIKCVSSCVEY